MSSAISDFEAARAKRQRTTIEHGEGPPHDPDMEARVAILEAQFKRIEALLGTIDGRLQNLAVEVAETKGRIANMPSTWAMIGTVIGGQVALAGLLFIAIKFGSGH